MKICIWWQTSEQTWGGGHKFLGRLSRELVRLGHEVTRDPNDHAGLVMINGFSRGPGPSLRPGMAAQLRQTGRVAEWSKYSPPWIWLALPRRGPLLVHRVDGVPELVRGFRSPADHIQAGLNRLADYTVFQTRYCQQSCEECGVRPSSFSQIANGVDPEVFYPLEKPRRSGAVLRLFASSWSDNPRKGFARLAEISQLPEVEVHFAGRWCKSIDPANVRLLGVKSSSGLAEAMREMDAMVHAAQNEPCSNAIIEALACGLPVLYLDSGGNRELAGEYGVPLSGNIAGDLEELRSRYDALRERVLADREQFLIHHVARQYVEVFEQVYSMRSIDQTCVT